MHYRPSVDVFFRSVAERWPEPGVAALLTGMGRDGAAGLLALRRAGWLTIAQDEASSVIWGMPGAAVHLASPGTSPAGRRRAGEHERQEEEKAEGPARQVRDRRLGRVPVIFLGSARAA